MSKVTIGIEDTDFEHPDVLVQLKAGLRHDVIGKECTVLLTNAGIEIERLRAALEFYAHAPHYVMQGWEIARDGGAKAREALSCI